LEAILHAWVGALGAAPKVLCTILELSRIKSIDSLAVVLERALQLVKSDLAAVLEVVCSNIKLILLQRIKGPENCQQLWR